MCSRTHWCNSMARAVYGMQVLIGACLKQGLIKQEGKQRYGEQFAMWQKRASEFEIDGQVPVRSIAAVHPRLLYVTASLNSNSAYPGPQSDHLCSVVGHKVNHGLPVKDRNLDSLCCVHGVPCHSMTVCLAHVHCMHAGNHRLHFW